MLFRTVAVDSVNVIKMMPTLRRCIDVNHQQRMLRKRGRLAKRERARKEKKERKEERKKERMKEIKN